MRRCPDCAAIPDDLHIPGCDVERCPRCGGQAIGCNCIYEVNGMNLTDLEEEYPDVFKNGPTKEMIEVFDKEWENRRQPWTGEWPGVKECQEYGFWCVGPPWKRCTVDTPGATEDINRLINECSWDADKGKFIRFR